MRGSLLAFAVLYVGSAHAQIVSAEITYEAGGYETLLKVVAPEDARCKINDRGLVQTQTVPFTLRAEPHMYYALDCTLPDGASWRKKVEARPRRVGVIRLGSTGGGAQVQGSSGPGDTPAAAPVAMTAAQFAKLEAAVKAASFSKDKLDIVRTAAAHSHVSVAQVGALMDLCSFSKDKVEVVRLLRAKVVDPANATDLAEHLSFSKDKKTVLALFQ